MATSIISAQAANTISDFSLSGGTSAQSADSFAQQFLTAIEGYLADTGNPPQLNINIQSAGQNSAGSSQFMVTVENPAVSTASSSGSSSSAAALATSSGIASSTPVVTDAAASILTPAVDPASTSGAAAGSAAAETTAAPAPVANTTPASPTAGESLTAAQLAQMTPTQAYWADQPPAVQALQNMPLDQRGAAAENLAAEGYTIDVPIMVWGWDPLATMLARQADGYTWVPSAMQADVTSAPGVDYSGSADYDPNNPPPGSIQVSTAFADGTNGQDAAAQYYETPPTTS